MKKELQHIIIFITALFFISCEREIIVELPEAEEKLVVEGFIEQNVPPIVFLTKSMGYFEPTDLQTLQNIIVKDALVTLNNGMGELDLNLICISELPDTILPLVSDLSGLTVDQLKALNYCFYTTLNQNYWGEIGKSYTLKINHNNKSYQSTSRIPEPVPVDSLWFIKREEGRPQGLVWMRISDPPGVYNAYRLYSKRSGKDPNYLPVFGSVFDDQFFDGKPVDFYFWPGDRGAGDFLRRLAVPGDTVVIKLCSIDAAVYRFIRDYETDVSSNGNPFAAPSTIHSNISGGALGYWGGYGATYDTLVVK